MNQAEVDAFLAIVESGSLTRAAQKLYLTQSTLSSRLDCLEKELGAPLLISLLHHAGAFPAGGADRGGKEDGSRGKEVEKTVAGDKGDYLEGRPADHVPVNDTECPDLSYGACIQGIPGQGG